MLPSWCFKTLFLTFQNKHRIVFTKTWIWSLRTKNECFPRSYKNRAKGFSPRKFQFVSLYSQRSRLLLAVKKERRLKALTPSLHSFDLQATSVYTKSVGGSCTFELWSELTFSLQFFSVSWPPPGSYFLLSVQTQKWFQVLIQPLYSRAVFWDSCLISPRYLWLAGPDKYKRHHLTGSHHVVTDVTFFVTKKVMSYSDSKLTLQHTTG